MTNEPDIEIFTDGACLGNPGPGGWGVLLRWRGTEKELSGGERDTTAQSFVERQYASGGSRPWHATHARVFSDGGGAGGAGGTGGTTEGRSAPKMYTS